MEPAKISLRRLGLGTAVSSLGTTTFTISQIAFFKLAGVSNSLVGTYLASTRFSIVLAMLLHGAYLAGSLSDRRLLLWSELFSGACGLGLLFLWPSIPHSFIAYTAIACLRSFFLQVQGGSRAAYVRKFSTSEEEISTGAIFLNKITHGPFAFAAPLAFLALTYGHFEWVILFDIMTFLFNGYLVWNLPEQSASLPSSSDSKKSFFQFFKELYANIPFFAVADLFLALCFSGLVLFMVRISNGNAKEVVLLCFAYGMALFVSSWKKLRGTPVAQLITIFFGVTLCFLALIFTSNFFIASFFLSFVAFILYWTGFNVISVQLQKSVAPSILNRVTTARYLQMVLILISGEYTLGRFSDQISHTSELLVRLLIGLVGALLCLLYKGKYVKD